MNDLVMSFLGDDGALKSRTDGLSNSIANLKKREDALSARLATREADLRKQFTTLDTMLGTMSSTSTYLTQQLAAIAKNTE